MTEVLFYQLERASLESVLPGLLEKTLERGWKAVVRCGARETVKRLDDVLWTYRDDAFLPHSADAESTADQPVFITDSANIPYKAEVLFLVDNAAAAPDAIAPYTRCVTIFDGGDEKAVAAARALRAGVKSAGHGATWWKQSPRGRWEKQD